MSATIYEFPLKEVMRRAQAKQFARDALANERAEEYRMARSYLHAAIDCYRNAGDETTAEMLVAYAYQIDCQNGGD